MFAAIIPAILLYLLIFMETQICELIIMEKTREAKGAGLHLDIVLLCLINFFSSLVGGPWVCAATVIFTIAFYFSPIRVEHIYKI